MNEILRDFYVSTSQCDACGKFKWMGNSTTIISTNSHYKFYQRTHRSNRTSFSAWMLCGGCIHTKTHICLSWDDMWWDTYQLQEVSLFLFFFFSSSIVFPSLNKFVEFHQDLKMNIEIICSGPYFTYCALFVLLAVSFCTCCLGYSCITKGATVNCEKSYILKYDYI